MNNEQIPIPSFILLCFFSFGSLFADGDLTNELAYITLRIP